MIGIVVGIIGAILTHYSGFYEAASIWNWIGLILIWNWGGRLLCVDPWTVRALYSQHGQRGISKALENTGFAWLLALISSWMMFGWQGAAWTAGSSIAFLCWFYASMKISGTPFFERTR